MAHEVLKALANPTNQAVLNLLAVEPAYPRRISDLTGISETEVARRLKRMEGMGLVASEWKHIGKNVKVYKLVATSATVRFGAEGLRLEIADEAGQATTAALLNHFAMRVPSAEGFVGRHAEMDLLTGPASVVVIEGMPGMGKTTLLAAYAAKAGPKRAVFWHGFRGVESLTWLSNRLAVFLAQHDERGLLDAVEAGLDLTDRRELMLDALDDARFAFLLDDVHTIDDEDLRRFLGDAVERTKTGKIVVAGRTRPHFAPAAGHVKHLRLEGLDDQGMVAFLEARGVPDAPRLLPRVRDEVGGHPLALTLLVETAHATDVGVEELLDRIPEEDLEEYLLEEVDGTLSDAERRVLGHASVFRTGFTIEDLSALSTRDPEGALYKLRRRLLIQHTEGDFSLHEVVRNFFYNRLRSKTDLHRKAAKHFVGTGTIEGRLEAMHHFLAAGDREHVLKLIERDLDLQEFDVIDAGYHNLYMEVLDAFVKDEVADERRWALIEDERGDIKLHAHDPAGALAHYETSAMFFEGAKDERRIADLAWKRAMACVALKRVDEAKALTKAGLKAAPEGSREAKRLNAFIAEQKWKS